MKVCLSALACLLRRLSARHSDSRLLVPSLQSRADRVGETSDRVGETSDRVGETSDRVGETSDRVR